MPILNIQTSQVGLIGVLPSLVYIATNDTIAQVTTTGYLNKAVQQGYTFDEAQMALVSIKTSPSAAATQVAWLEISKSGADWSLVTTGSPGDIILPTVANQLVHATNTTGSLSTGAANVTNAGSITTSTGNIVAAAGNIVAGASGAAGTLISFPATAANGTLIISALNAGGAFNTTIRNSVMGQSTVYSIPDAGAATANFIISSLTGAGTQHITTGNLQADTGSFTAGSSGNPGVLASFPPTAANGTLFLQAANAGGNFLTVISNGTMGQTTVYTIPDAVSATARFLVAATATPFTSGNLVKSSGTGGLMVDAGFAVKANTTAAYGGGGTSNAFTATGLTASSIVTAVILTSTNAVAIAKAVPTANTLTVTFTADPGAATTVSWIAITPAV